MGRACATSQLCEPMKPASKPQVPIPVPIECARLVIGEDAAHGPRVRGFPAQHPVKRQALVAHERHRHEPARRLALALPAHLQARHRRPQRRLPHKAQ